MNDTRSSKLQALKAAFPHTIPILTGFLFLGMAYGVFMNASGFHWFYPFIISLTVYAGSMQFVAVNLLLGAFNPIGALMLTLMVNARHLFYGISMLEKYSATGRIKPYLIFGLTDETFSINSTVEPPQNVDRKQFYLSVTLLNQIYWVTGATLGGIFGALLDFNLEGLEFVMTALLLVIFLEQWMKDKKHTTALIGLGVTALSLFIFGSSDFIIPAMLGIVGVLTLFRKNIEKAGDAK